MHAPSQPWTTRKKLHMITYSVNDIDFTIDEISFQNLTPQFEDQMTPTFFSKLSDGIW